MSENINIFISYSWDSIEHQQWVLSLADTIENQGAKAIIDRKDLKYGGHIKTFMLKSILESDIVLIILTSNYKRKADGLEGGAGYEYNIINDELFKIIVSNEKFIPIIREGSFESSTTNFLRGFNCVDLRDGQNYNRNLKELLDQIFSNDISHALTNDTKTSIMEEYKDIPLIAKEVKERAFKYFQQLFINDDKAGAAKKMSAVAKEWTEQIEEYHNSFVKKFNPNKMEIYEEQLEDFKNNVFGKQLWTVKAALNTPDPDLARYKKDFRDADSVEVFDTVNGILNAAHYYNENISIDIDYKKIYEVSELEMGFLSEEGMFMNKVIGFGIRSEILHRYYPGLFPIMTQPSLWAMYFICENNYEFITIEKRVRESRMRVSHNWQYPYDRFSFIINVIANELFTWFENYDIKLDYNLRFGYVNCFFSLISELHKQDTKLLHEWVDTK